MIIDSMAFSAVCDTSLLTTPAVIKRGWRKDEVGGVEKGMARSQDLIFTFNDMTRDRWQLKSWALHALHNSFFSLGFLIFPPVHKDTVKVIRLRTESGRCSREKWVLPFSLSLSLSGVGVRGGGELRCFLITSREMWIGPANPYNSWVV